MSTIRPLTYTQNRPKSERILSMKAFYETEDKQVDNTAREVTIKSRNKEIHRSKEYQERVSKQSRVE